MPGFGVLVLIFLFGVGLFGAAVKGKPTITDSGSGRAVGPWTHVAVVSQADSGKTITLRRGPQTDLRLSHRSRWSEPVATGPVTLQPVASLVDMGYDAWHIVPMRKGTATITSTGLPGPRRFQVTIHVE